jgi:hypothetical protein
VTTAGTFTGPTGSDASAATYRPGKILQYGGNSRNAIVVDIFNAAGTPAVAPIVRVGVAANPNPAITPSLVNPGNQAGDAATATSLSLSATDPNSDALTAQAGCRPAC